MILHIPLAHTGRNEVAPLAGARLTGARAARVGLCLGLMLVAFLLFPAETSAHASTLATGGPTLQINVGFNDDSRVGYWTPVQITLSNDGPDFTGTLSATTYTSPLPSGLLVGDVQPWSYQQSVTLPHGTQKQATLYVPFFESPALPRAIIATLRDSHGRVILTQTQTPYSLRGGAILVGILSDQSTGFDALSAVTLPSPTRSIEVATLNASTIVYSVTDGSITFEFVLPDTALFTSQTGISQISSMTISGALMKRPENTGHVQVRLYNWCTSSWNTFALSHDTFTIGVPKAYTSSDGRVLLQLANQNSSSEVLAHV